MTNTYSKNPVVLDTAGGGLEHEEILFLVESVEWVKPTATDHTATLLDASGNTIVEFKCVTANLNMIKYFNPAQPFYGMNVTALSSGKLLVTRV